LTGHGKQVVETGCAKGIAQPRVEALVLAENDPAQDRPPFAGESGSDRACEPLMQAVGEASHASAVADDLPARAVEDDVHGTSAQPGALVEAVVRRPRRLDVDQELEARALRRRPPRRERQQHRFGNATVADELGASEDANGERRASRRRGHYRDHPLRGADERQQHAAVEHVEPRRSPRQPAECEEERHRDATRGLAAHQHNSAEGHRRSCSRDREGDAPSDSAGNPRTKSEEVDVRPADHGATRSRSCSIFAAPTPGMASRSSTEENAPCFSR
jgi:hypothetical protein